MKNKVCKVCKVCKCGHKEKDHYRDMVNRTLACRHKNCTCKKFKVEEVCENCRMNGIEPKDCKHKNHNESEGTLHRRMPYGSDNIHPAIDKAYLYTGRPEDTLSSKMVKRIGMSVYMEKDIKEFIKKLKEEVFTRWIIQYPQYKEITMEDLKDLWKEIDKLAGKELLE